MRIIVLLGDGMGDYPLPELSEKTPLQQAKIPNIRRLAAGGRVRQIQTVPKGMPPGSDVANLSVMGFDPRRYYTGRAPIEAAGANLKMTPEDVAFRCNLINVENGLIKDHSAGHISTSEGSRLIAAIQAKLGSDALLFAPGAGYRHLLIWRNGPASTPTTPPHDVLGQPVEQNLPTGGGAAAIINLMQSSRAILRNHPVNLARKQKGEDQATQIWLWGQGRRTELPLFKDLYGLTGGVISAVDLLRGIGNLTGLEAPVVPGTTGFLDTDYAGKVQAAQELLTAGHNFVFLHIEAPDECGHMGDLKLKIQAIEDFDREVVGPVWRTLEADAEPYRLIVTTDHRTPIAVRGHTPEHVPLLVFDGPRKAPLEEQPFDEFTALDQPIDLAFDCMQKLLTC